ncbi:MAG: hypothetical protein QOF93_1437 [Verrucomicrobiota bacterium]|jgi:hypothetical protein
MIRRIILGIIALSLVALVLGGFLVNRGYHAACLAVDTYMITATDGPWVRSKVRLVLDWADDPSSGVELHWIFRFHNPQNGGESKRIYAPFSGDRAFSYKLVLDPVPLLGSRP